MIRSVPCLRPLLLAGAAALAMPLLSPADQARADDCLLDTNNDGNADSNVDTDLGADSGGLNTRVACGENALATGSFSTAIGSQSAATASSSTALGYNSDATGLAATALGQNAVASGGSSVAVGQAAFADFVDSVVVGQSADVGGIGAVAIGAAATTADHHLIFNPTNRVLMYDADGVGGVAAVQLLVLSDATASNAASDIIVV